MMRVYTRMYLVHELDLTRTSFSASLLLDLRNFSGSLFLMFSTSKSKN